MVRIIMQTCSEFVTLFDRSANNYNLQTNARTEAAFAEVPSCNASLDPLVALGSDVNFWMNLCLNESLQGVGISHTLLFIAPPPLHCKLSPSAIRPIRQTARLSVTLIWDYGISVNTERKTLVDGVPAASSDASAFVFGVRISEERSWLWPLRYHVLLLARAGDGVFLNIF